MKKFLLLSLALLATLNAWAQFRSTEVMERYTFEQSIIASPTKTMFPGVKADPVVNYRARSPLMISSSSWDWRMQNNFFWTGSVTTLSFNKGKFGTYFYWDVQGNLRGTRGFIDISGKNKRGFKLLFPWR